MKLPLTLIAALFILAGCASAPKPNEAQSWGFWSRVPGTKSYAARKAEVVIAPRLEEKKKELTFMTMELIDAAIATNAAHQVEYGTPPNTPLNVAGVVSKQNVVLHGTPIKPIDITPFLPYTNSPPAFKRAAEALQDLKDEFKAQSKDLAAVAKTEAVQEAKGHDLIKQDSSGAVTVWQVVEGIKSFINAHWMLLLALAVIGIYIGRAVLTIYNPPLAFGVNKVAGVGVRAAKRLAGELMAGGEEFKSWLEENIKAGKAIDPAEAKKQFRIAQERKQSPETQATVAQLTRRA